MRIGHAAIAVLLSVGAAFAADTPRRAIAVGPLTIYGLVEGDFEYGCGLSVYTPASAGLKGTLVADWPVGESFRIFTDGGLQSLPVQRDFGRRAARVGQAETLVFGDATRSAKLTLKTTWVCPQNSESCEVTEYVGTLRLAVAGRTGRIPVYVSFGC
jgi:hypothetical protein